MLHLHQRNGLSNICKLLRRMYDAAMLEAWPLWALRDAELTKESRFCNYPETKALHSIPAPT